jgi:hypothetical protein
MATFSCEVGILSMNLKDYKIVIVITLFYKPLHNMTKSVCNPSERNRTNGYAPPSKGLSDHGLHAHSSCPVCNAV